MLVISSRQVLQQKMDNVDNTTTVTVDSFIFNFDDPVTEITWKVSTEPKEDLNNVVANSVAVSPHAESQTITTDYFTNFVPYNQRESLVCQECNTLYQSWALYPDGPHYFKMTCPKHMRPGYNNITYNSGLGGISYHT